MVFNSFTFIIYKIFVIQNKITMKFFIFIFFFFLIFPFKSMSNEDNSNYYNINYSLNDLANISKSWIYSSKVFKDTQSKLIQYKDKIIHLDGKKNLHVISLITGKLICQNTGLPDRTKYRGVSLYFANKEKNEVYAVFPRRENIKIIDIFSCKEKKLSNKIKINNLLAPILIYKNTAVFLPNGGLPSAYNLRNGKLKWQAWISKKNKKKLIKINKKNLFNWDVWGGGVIDEKFNQIIFSTANAKPSFVSTDREGPNLFFNSLVAISLDTGEYKWHFQEIEHDVLNLDLAAPPVIFNNNNRSYVLQATKSGQLIILNRLNGIPTEKYTEKLFYHSQDKKIFTKKKIFDNWLQFSKSSFVKDDINQLNLKYSDEAKQKINNSITTEYTNLKSNINYIHYGFHGGAEWPGIGVTEEGTVIIPGNNIAWVSKLRNVNDFDFDKETRMLFKYFKSIFVFNYSKFKWNVKKTIFQFKKIYNYKKVDIEKYQRFVSEDGIPLNSPPWSNLTSIDIIKKKINWQIPHGYYPNLLDNKIKTGSETFGCPVIAGKNIFFMSGTRDKKIYAYSILNGEKLWEDELPFVSYGCPIIGKYNSNILLLVNASGGSKFRDVAQGDKIVAYKLK